MKSIFVKKIKLNIERYSYRYQISSPWPLSMNLPSISYFEKTVELTGSTECSSNFKEGKMFFRRYC